MHTSRCFGFYPAAESVLLPLPGEQRILTYSAAGFQVYGALARVNALWVTCRSGDNNPAPIEIRFENNGEPQSGIYLSNGQTIRLLASRDVDQIKVIAEKGYVVRLWTEAVAGFRVEDRP